MLINYDSNPRNSIIYSAAIILEFLKRKQGSNNYEDVCNYCISRRMEYSIFVLSIDWLYLVGLIKEFNNRNELILCD